jgi:hypothetical protein
MPRQQGRAGNPLPQAVAAKLAGELRDHRPANRTVKERRL